MTSVTQASGLTPCIRHERWAYLRDVLILLPTWPPERVIELAPKS
ncbi:hypothetical protein [Sorangium sp. So ce124]